MSPKPVYSKRTKFTIGEKCLFIHVVITFALVLALVIIYYVHLLVMNHTGRDMFQVTRRSSHTAPDGTTVDDSKFNSIGVLFLNITPIQMICNTLLLRPRWSLVSAHCATLRSEPDLSIYLYTWKIKYKINGSFIHTSVEQNFVHSHFSRDDFSNNIGLLKHKDYVHGPDYIVPMNGNITDLINSGDILIAGWTQSEDSSDTNIKMQFNAMTVITSGRCNSYVSPVIGKLRIYEFCTSFKSKIDDPFVGLGALFYIDNQIVGLFSWGDRGGKGVPLVILNIVHFKNWFEDVISL